MYILFGQSIDEGMNFIGAFETETEARAAKHELDFNEKFDKLACKYTWRIIKLHQCLMNAMHHPQTRSQVT